MRIAESYVDITVIPCDPHMAKQQAQQETVISYFHNCIRHYRMMMSSFQNEGSFNIGNEYMASMQLFSSVDG